MSPSQEKDIRSVSTESELHKDEDGNEITFWGKFLAGLLLISLTTVSTIIIVGYWPDRLPAPKESIKPLYTNKLFHVNLVGIPDSARMRYEDENSGTIAEKTGVVTNADTVKDNSDSTDSIPRTKNILKGSSSVNSTHSNVQNYPLENKLLHINTILLILVTAGGFLGNLIYISTSFTTYIGSGKFKKSWTLWYCVKPFTAAGLAVTIYFVFRGGFLNMSDNSTNINIYGVLTISLLAGLFTDRTTLKLKEVFDVLLKPKEDRPDSLENDELKILDIEPKVIQQGRPNEITIKGKNLNQEGISVLIEGEKVQIVKNTAQEIKLLYQVPETQTLSQLRIAILNKKKEEVYWNNLKVKAMDS